MRSILLLVLGVPIPLIILIGLFSHFQLNVPYLTTNVVMTGASFAFPQQADQSAKQDIKDAGNSTKDAAKDTGRATKKTAKKTGHTVKTTSKRVTHKAAKKTQEGAQKVEDKTKPN